MPVPKFEKYVKFGSSDMMVSELCLGTMVWGSFCDEAEAFAQLDKAMEMGINFIDTAEMYPTPNAPKWANRTEVYIGNWLESRMASSKVDRSKLYIATKLNGNSKLHPPAAWINHSATFLGRADPLGDRPPKDLDPDNLNWPDFSAEQLMTACKASLQRLRCEYIDLYQLHWPQRYVPVFGKVEYKPEREFEEEKPTPEHFDKIVLGLKALFDAKLIKNWGLSNETSFGIMSFCAACDRNNVPRPVSVQNDCSMTNRGFEEQLAEVCRHFNIAGMPYGALAGGTLSGKYDNADGQEPPSKKARHLQFPKFQPRYQQEAVIAASRKYSALARKHSLTPTQLAVAWANSRWWNTSVISGTTSVAQLEEYASAFFIKLSPEILAEVDAIHKEGRNPNIMDI